MEYVFAKEEHQEELTSDVLSDEEASREVPIVEGLPKFTINGESYQVTKDIHPSMRLLQFLREHASLTGTKSMCHEGGCNLCAVVVNKYDYTMKMQLTKSVPSCQVFVYSCDGWDITTIEGLGNKFDGYHPIQEALVQHYGTQCGYCTPGMIMTMYGQAKKYESSFTKTQIEKSMDGNLCRCTGYRPILDAFKSMAVDKNEGGCQQIGDIEDIFCVRNISDFCENKTSCDPKPGRQASASGIKWYWPTSLASFQRIISEKTKEKKRIRIVAGNTGLGVYKSEPPYEVYVDLGHLEALQKFSVGPSLRLGANFTLTDCIRAFELAEKHPGFEQLALIARHWRLVANTGIRNVGTWAGNLALKHQHREFPSDIFLTLLVLSVDLDVFNPITNSMESCSLEEFLKRDLRSTYIVYMRIPRQHGYTIRTYKITRRTVNSHAYVNAAFRFKLGDNFTFQEKPTILFGGINPEFIHAHKTEKFLEGKSLELDPDLPRKAGEILLEELIPDDDPANASPQYRKCLAACLLYKAMVDVLGDKVWPSYQSAGPVLKRPLSHGKQTFDKNEEDWPIGQPVPKLESYLQASGEAEFIDDTPLQHREVHGAFVQTAVANATILHVDVSEALKLPGVLDYVEAKDIPGRNSFLSAEFYSAAEPLFATTHSRYAGQAVGLIIAKTRNIAIEAVKKVSIKYKPIAKPVLTIKDALTNQNPECETIESDNINGSPSAERFIKGEVQFGSQYHFYTECMSAIVVPKDDEYDVWASTQFVHETQCAIAEVLAIDANRLNFNVRRLGGAFGGKISRGNVAACGAAVAARKMKRPVRIVLPLDVNMTLVGWREPYLSKYKVGFNDEGLLKDVEVDFIADVGVAENDTSVETAALIPGPYYSEHWKFNPKFVHTDTASNTWCRAPGSVEAFGTMETIIEHVAAELQIEPSLVRERNFSTDLKKNKNVVSPQGENITATIIFPKLKEKAEYEKRKELIEEFNKTNRWKKRGISILPLLYVIDYAREKFQVQVVIYSSDGTVSISHGGIEMGQGINTKVAQVAAKILGIPLDKIKVKATNNFVGANSSMCAGSLGSDLCAHGTQVCCEKLKSRIDVVRAKMEQQTNEDIPWDDLIAECNQEEVDLIERYWTVTKEHPKGYDIFGAACVEVEVDILTGQFVIRRSDIIEDVGRSLSPLIDVGQVEGSMVMSFGLFSSEEVKYDPENGRKLTKNTWEYKVPSALDIPVDFRVSFMENGSNPFGVARSKATGEPAMCLGFCLVTALRQAITSARYDAGRKGFFEIDTPLTPERIHNLCSVKSSDFVIPTKEVEHIKSNL